MRYTRKFRGGNKFVGGWAYSSSEKLDKDSEEITDTNSKSTRSPRSYSRSRINRKLMRTKKARGRGIYKNKKNRRSRSSSKGTSSKGTSK